MSMNPGATTIPSASIVRSPVRPSPIPTIPSPSTLTSVKRPGPPVPLRTKPFLITAAGMCPPFPGALHHSAPAGRLAQVSGGGAHLPEVPAHDLLRHETKPRVAAVVVELAAGVL